MYGIRKTGGISISLPSYTLVLACIALLLAFSGLCTAVEQAPVMPHAFYGVVYVGEQAAPAGASVEGRGAGVTVPLKGNPILTGSGGTYGAPGSYTAKLIVQGTLRAGDPIEFYVNGARAEVQDVKSGGGWTATYPFHSTGVTELNLRIETLPGTTVTTSPTTSTTTETTTVTATATTWYTSGGGGGGGGGIAAPAAAGTTATTAATPAMTGTASPEHTAEETVPATTMSTPIPPTETITSPPTTAVPLSAPGLPPMDQLILYGVGALVLITAISLVAVGKYEGWWGRKPPEEP